MTDEINNPDQDMTDQFIKVFLGRYKVESSIFASDKHAYVVDHRVLMSPKTFSDYTKWTKTLPSLLKELI